MNNLTKFRLKNAWERLSVRFVDEKNEGVLFLGLGISAGEYDPGPGLLIQIFNELFLLLIINNYKK